MIEERDVLVVMARLRQDCEQDVSDVYRGASDVIEAIEATITPAHGKAIMSVARGAETAIRAKYGRSMAALVGVKL